MADLLHIAFPEGAPGSAQAVCKGCLCPQIDNHHGRGIQVHDEFQFLIRQDCPIHSSPAGGGCP